MDSVVVLNELIDLATRRKDECMVFKVDFERAYDTVSWKYLEKMMIKMGFAEGWMKWMKACVFESFMSVLVNGSPTSDFKVSKGLRQGDPLSPFLFLIAAEGLTGLVKRAVSNGSFHGFKVSDNIQFQILQFADDTVLVGEGSWENVWTIKTILRGFELVFGMRINFVKSKLYGINVNDRFLEAASNFLLCRTESIPFKFLGLPVGENPRKLITWKPVVESMEKRLSGWNGRHLSIGGLEGKQLCWVSWDQVCLPKVKGGLGVKDLKLFNLALLSKWKWRCIVDNDVLWYDLSRFRYEESFGNLLSWEVHKSRSKDSIWWRDILKVGGMAGDLWFPKNVCSMLGDGNLIGFWKEKWLGDVPFCELFPNLFAKELDQNIVVAKRLVGSRGNRLWYWQWDNVLTSEDEDDLSYIQHLLLDVDVVRDRTDAWKWMPNSLGMFTVKSVYTILQNGRSAKEINPSILVSIQRLWKNDVPSKVGVFGWRLLLDKLPTRAALIARGCAYYHYVEGWEHFDFFGGIITLKKGEKDVREEIVPTCLLIGVLLP
ncbi:hypothetical protein TSUD_379210 [Trifolium subterraneum]|uniref:Reverse transcriptase domain-containing protein n=1 Tax=Trifolium subterraneum TaxID=3900 RepID=A0A2Z6NSG1_TRISU|nr:hypothetical protein TSUD_379210 [Trifolium subterraneum]